MPRYVASMYTDEGKKATERLWKETIEELKFSHVEDIISIK